MMDMKKQGLSALSSGSDGSGVLDERKRKRMLSNRESARRSRMKKLKQMDDVIGQIAQLRSENARMTQQIAATEQSYMYVAAERDVALAEAMSLTGRLQSLNEVIYIAEQVNGLAADVSEIPESFIEPWLLPYQALQCPASVNMFQC